jgi:hypothetical protein
MSYETFRDKQKMRINVANLGFTTNGFIINTRVTAQIMMVCGISQCACYERSRILQNALMRLCGRPLFKPLEAL